MKQRAIGSAQLESKAVGSFGSALADIEYDRAAAELEGPVVNSCQRVDESDAEVTARRRGLLIPRP